MNRELHKLSEGPCSKTCLASVMLCERRACVWGKAEQSWCWVVLQGVYSELKACP
jgi:hypothetical protein